jgi:hypothetical protein
MREEGIKNVCLDRTWIISRASVNERVRTAGHCVPSKLGRKPVALRKSPNNAPQSACGMDIGGCPQLGQHDAHAFGAIQYGVWMKERIVDADHDSEPWL